MDKSSLTFKAFKNSSYNALGYVWPIAFTLIVTPLIVFGLGVKDYGIYLFVNTVIGLFGLLDLGLGNAVTKHISYYYGKNDEQSMKRLGHSANSLFFIIAFIGLVATAAISVWGIDILPGKFAEYDKYSILFIIGGGIFFLNTISSTSNSIIVAVQRFDIYNKISIASTTMMSLGTLLVIKMGGSLVAVFLMQLVFTAIVNFLIIHNAKKLLPISFLGLEWDKSEIKKCYMFGLVNFVNNIATSALTSLDRLIIPLFVGPTNLTYYSMPGNVTTKIPAMSHTMGMSLFPTVSQLSGSEDIDRIKTLYIRSFRLITILAGALTIVSISFSYKILLFWLDSNFAEKSSAVLIVLALTNFILALFNPLSNFLLGLGKLKFLTLSSLSMALLNIILLFILLPKYGILGAAYAYLISVLPVAYFFYYVEKHYLILSGRKNYYIKVILGTIITSALIWVINLGLTLFIVNLPTLLLVGAGSVLLYIILYRVLGFFHEEDWADLERFSSILISKILFFKKP